MEFEECRCRPVKDRSLIRKLWKNMNKLMYEPNDHSHDHSQSRYFPGCAPVPLSRSDFDFVRSQKDNYWVCEKSDGKRALMLVLSSGIYLLDKKCAFYKLDDAMIIPYHEDLTRMQNGTILDGELTYNFHYEKYCFMIFDIVAINGERVANLSLTNRLKEVRDKIITPYRNRYTPDDIGKKLPLVILGKEFFKLKQIDKLFKHIEHFPPEDENSFTGHRYLYKKEKRYNDTDGIILTLDTKEYKPGRCISMKKWKFPELNSVDFLLKVRYIAQKGNIFSFHIKKDNHLDQYRKVFFSSDCVKRLLKDIGNDKSALIECVYDSWNTGEWVYHRVRNDKNSPVQMRGLVQHMEICAQKITQDILLNEFSLSPDGIETPVSDRRTPLSSADTPRSYEGIVAESPAGELIYESPDKYEFETTPIQNYSRKRKLVPYEDICEPAIKKPKMD
eukprot:TRINITY_DN11134_c0_g1_i1.p1 TRINITY_DN11134_c0_g1~~TRINITY_DN11134_c0_g1_i1.p1  ORF type:complete len:446 (-),score=85.74 TRINITY_DN11134_c0_g1_i1:66-1403(-)